MLLLEHMECHRAVFSISKPNRSTNLAKHLLAVSRAACLSSTGG